MRAHLKKGFTLVELLIVVAIIALLTALALPSFQEYYEKARLRGAADEVVALLAEARQSAVRQNKRVAVSFGGAVDAWCAGANVALDPAVGTIIPDAIACDCTLDACSLSRPRASNGSVVAWADIPADQKRRVLATSFTGVERDPDADEPVNFTFDPIMGTRADLVGDSLDLVSSTRRYSLRVEMTATGQARACRLPGPVDNVNRIITGYRDCAP